VPRRTAVNTFLVHAGGRVALVDTGCGDAMAATAGKLQSQPRRRGRAAGGGGRGAADAHAP
jgi:hypothetical protein